MSKPTTTYHTAVNLPSESADKVLRIARSSGFKAWLVGSVEAGPKQVIIEPKNIVLTGDSLEVR